MARHSFPQRVVLALLLAMVLAAPAMGAQPRPRDENRQAGFITALVSELRVQFWTLLTRSWEKEGCGLDPHGGCAPSSSGNTSATAEGDAGCGLDPHGGCGH